MLWRAGQAEAALVLTTFEVEVLHTAVAVGVVAVETDALQGRSDEAEVALVTQFNAEQVGVTRVARLAELGIDIAVPFVVAEGLIHDEIVNFLVEEAGADHTY